MQTLTRGKQLWFRLKETKIELLNMILSFKHITAKYRFLGRAWVIWFLLFDAVCVSVCQQDYGKTSQMIFMKLGGRMQHGPRKNPLHFGADLNPKADTPLNFHLY